MSLSLERGRMSGTVTVTNNANNELNLQLSARAWDQDKEGKDRYVDTQDVVFYPRIMTVAPGEQRLIRLGMKGVPGAKERSYRLFLEEMAPKRSPTERNKPGVNIVMRISIPVFLSPLKTDSRLVMEKLSLEKGMLTVVVENTGTVHARLRTVRIRGLGSDGTARFEAEQAGWYVLPGTSRPFRFAVTSEHCSRLARIEVTAAGENITLDGTLNVRKEMCSN
jgi:fimbrial chaperone protein